MNPPTGNANEEPKGFEALLKQNEIAEAKREAENPTVPIEERIRAEAPEKPFTSVKSIRTFKGDIAESVALGQTTPVSLATAQADVRHGFSLDLIKQSKNTKTALVVLVSILLIGIGTFGGWYALSTFSGTPKIFEGQPTLLITSEQAVTLDVTNTKADTIRALLIEGREKAVGQLNTTIAVIPTTATALPDGGATIRALSASEFFTALGLDAPSALVRAFESNYLFGIHIFDGNQPFLIFKVTSYENAFSGMLAWEEAMIRSLGPIMRKESDLPLGGTVFSRPTFEDMVVRNVDARVLKNQSGKILLLYSFPNRSTLIITSNTETFNEVLLRLNSRSVVR